MRSHRPEAPGRSVTSSASSPTLPACSMTRPAPLQHPARHELHGNASAGRRFRTGAPALELAPAQFEGPHVEREAGKILAKAWPWRLLTAHGRTWHRRMADMNGSPSAMGQRREGGR